MTRNDRRPRPAGDARAQLRKQVVAHYGQSSDPGLSVEAIEALGLTAGGLPVKSGMIRLLLHEAVEAGELDRVRRRGETSTRRPCGRERERLTTEAAEAWRRSGSVAVVAREVCRDDGAPIGWWLAAVLLAEAGVRGGEQ